MTSKSEARLQRASVATATAAHNTLWTPEEDAAVAKDVPLDQVASMLGRTYYACQQRRRLLKYRADPTLLALLPHGRKSTYNAGCKCDQCRKVASAATRNSRRTRRQAEVFLSGDFKHGINGYNLGCPCDVCRATNRLRARRYFDSPGRREERRKQRTERAEENSNRRGVARRSTQESLRTERASREKDATRRWRDRSRDRRASAVRKAVHWSEEEDRVALDYSLSHTQVAAKLGRSYNAVSARRLRLRLQTRFYEVVADERVS
jgi:hypothetical protein